VKDLAVAVTFLTRLRLDARVLDDEELAASVPWFPVVGAMIGLAVGAVYVGLAAVMPAYVAAPVAITAGLFLTGAFHEDGLADTIDAVGGGRSVEERLEIMRDPRHGTYGVLALVAGFAIRGLALSALGSWVAVAGMVAAHTLSRTSAVVLLATVTPASGDGLGAAYARGVSKGRALAAVLLGAALGALALGPIFVPAAGVAAIAATSVGLIAARALGGITGDVLGAAQQVGEGLILVTVSAFSWSGLLRLPWW
jgi:adenosylcobinamide-GDP ribazoletransferase